MSKSNISNATSSVVFPQTAITMAIRDTLEQMIPDVKIKFLEQELKTQSQKMMITIEAETTPTTENKAVGIKGSFTTPNDLDYITVAQWQGTVQVLGELNNMLNSKRLKWENSLGYEPRNFEFESIEAINESLKVITNAKLMELGIATKKYKFEFHVKTVRNNGTLTELKVEGFAHMHMPH